MTAGLGLEDGALEGSLSSQQADQVCIVSWNSRGSSEQKLQFMKKLVSSEIVGDKIRILCNQENFILRSNSYKLYQTVPGFQFFCEPRSKKCTGSRKAVKWNVYLCTRQYQELCF